MVVAYLPNQAREGKLLSIGEERTLKFSPMNLATVSLVGASRMDEIAPKQPVTIDFNIKTPASCTGGFTAIGKAVYDYNMKTIGTMDLASKTKYDELIKAGKLKRTDMGTTSTSGPILISMKTTTPMPISADKRFVFIMTPLNKGTGTVRINEFNVYIPKDFSVYTYEVTGEYTCSLSKDNTYKDTDYDKYMVDLRGTSERCFSTEIGEIYSCPLQLKPEALSKLIDIGQYAFKADIEYTYAVKKTVQFNVINSMSMGVMEYKQCPQRETYKDDQYNLLTCDDERDYYYMCDQGFINSIISAVKEYIWDDVTHCYDYNNGIGNMVYTELKIDNVPPNTEIHGKLIRIGNVASYLAGRADVQASRLSGMDNEFLNDASLIASNINAYDRLKRRALLENQQIDAVLKADIQDTIVGMIEYTYSTYFLSKKEYEFDFFNYVEWETGHPYLVNALPYNVEDLFSLTINEIKNIMPFGQATKPEHIVFAGSIYPMASNALNDRVNELNTIDYPAYCAEHYESNPKSPRFCVETNPCHTNLLGVITIVPCVTLLGVTSCPATGACPGDISDQRMEISTLIQDIVRANRDVDSLIKKKGKTKEDFSKILLVSEINKIMTDSIVPDAIGVQMNYDWVIGDVCGGIHVQVDAGVEEYCLYQNGTLCGAPSGAITLDTFHDKFVIVNTYAYNEYNTATQTIVATTGRIRDMVDEILDE